MSQSKGQSYTIGFNYKCGLCKQVSRYYKEEKGMKLWCRLHFKKFPACKEHHHEHGLEYGVNDSFVDSAGKSHFIRSGRTGELSAYAIQEQPKFVGHQKAKKREDLQSCREVEKYTTESQSNINFRLQILGDIMTWNDEGICMSHNISQPSQAIKPNKKKKKKKKKTKKTNNYKDIVEEQVKRQEKIRIGECINIDNLISKLPTEYA